MVSNVRLFDTPFGRIGSGIVHVGEYPKEPSIFLSNSSGDDCSDDKSLSETQLTISTQSRPGDAYLPEDLPVVDWLRIVLPRKCGRCRYAHDIVFFISRSGETRSTLPEGPLFEQWF